eukprot:6202430-Pleurochrysis_carterae.AAC.3
MQLIEQHAFGRTTSAQVETCLSRQYIGHLILTNGCTMQISEYPPAKELSNQHLISKTSRKRVKV